jgi:hypothetical protein
MLDGLFLLNVQPVILYFPLSLSSHWSDFSPLVYYPPFLAPMSESPSTEPDVVARNILIASSAYHWLLEYFSRTMDYNH